MENTNVNTVQAIELLQDEVERGNDNGLVMKMRFCAGGEPVMAEVRAGGIYVFDLPVKIEPPLPESTPPSAPNAEVEEVKSNILGWLTLALKETARLNIHGRMSMADMAMSEIQNTMSVVRRYIC